MMKMKLRTPLQIHRYRKEKKYLEWQIRDVSRRYARTLDDYLRTELVELHLTYKYKYFKEYKG